MTGAHKVVGGAAMLLLLFTLTTAPARAQFGGGGDMMTKMAPMLEMMKAKMGKRRFAMVMQTVGPMASGMMENGGGGLGGMMGGGGYGGMLSNASGQMMTMAPQLMSMAPQLMRFGRGGHRRHRRH